MAKAAKRLGEILIEMQIISAAEVNRALEHAKAKNLRIGEALVDLKLASEANVYKALAMQHSMEYVELDKGSIPPDQLSRIPEDLMRKYLVLPLGQENGKMRVATHDPRDVEMMDILRFRMGREIKPVLAPRSRIKAVLDELFNATSRNTIDKTLDKTIDRLSATMDKSMDRSLDKSLDRSIDKSIDQVGLEEGTAGGDATQAPIIKLVQSIIIEAVRNRASDIHIEPMKDRVQLRYRIDGECVVRDKIPIKMKGPLISRVKIMAGIDIAEKRLPQDGRIKMVVDKQMIDFRVSTLPSYHGESVVLRILRPDSVRIGLENLGFAEEDYKTFMKLIKRPNGIFLVTGPTGSGKTTTLYGALNVLNRPDRKIITAEDPVEYNFPGINQCQIRDNIGFTFKTVLRAMLRQAPNIILVGEIRDLEVAEIAIQAALTGHLVFSTLHTNDAPSAITRLIDMGVKPFLVASSIQAVMAQRLIRVLCPKCKQPDNDPDPMWLKLCGITKKELEGKQLMKPRGCDYCTGTGFRGRVGIFELMVMNSELRTLAFERAPTNRIRKAALASGMKSLLQDGKLKVLSGTSTAEEVVKVAQVEGVITS
ncbi:MAG: ATPase, T2SS/T4P/T4SS family [Phycisphaerae bacterium]|nr:ATPase, T2SS/T4P/T4SS family [Phycisphaerae bacterium]MDW8261296.1 ATPase, T2SS/T4P/T4SS family [Phycisphaerales bacterium]